MVKKQRVIGRVSKFFSNQYTVGIVTTVIGSAIVVLVSFLLFDLPKSNDSVEKIRRDLMEATRMQEANLDQDALSKFELAISELEERNESSLLVSALNGAGYCCTKIAKRDNSESTIKRAINYIERATELAVAIGDSTLLSSSAYFLASAYSNFSLVRETRENLSIGHEWMKRSLRLHDDGCTIALSLHLLQYGNFLEDWGAILGDQDSVFRAISVLQQASGESNAESTWIRGRIYNSLGIVESEAAFFERPQEHRSEALRHYVVAESCFQVESRPYEHAMLRNNRGVLYLDLADVGDRVSNLRLAEKEFEAALMIYTPSSWPAAHASCITNMAITHVSLSEFESSLEHLNKARSMIDEAIPQVSISKSPTMYARLNRALGISLWYLARSEKSHSRYNAALEAFDQCLLVYTPERYPRYYREVQHDISAVKSEMKDKRL